MSVEKIINFEKKDSVTLKNIEEKEKIFNGRVDINELLARVRKEKEKESKTNIVFFGLFASLVLIVGILLSF